MLLKKNRIKLKKGFGFYFDDTKTTSGQRFFKSLCFELKKNSIPLSEFPEKILFNISAPLKEILKAKFRKQKIILRVDGIYCDLISENFINEFNFPLKFLLKLLIFFKVNIAYISFIANFFNRNYPLFIKIYLADLIIYQSIFSYNSYKKYFPGKKYEIIVNGSIQYLNDFNSQNNTSQEIRLVTIYDHWKPAKRIANLIEFTKWAVVKKNLNIKLYIIGYNNKIPKTDSIELANYIESSEYIVPVYNFKNFTDDINQVFYKSDIYITFSYRDPCPNAVVEAMAHGLPVLAINSGGIIDIVENSGCLIEVVDLHAEYSPNRFDNNFPEIPFNEVYSSLIKMKSNLSEYRLKTIDRFMNSLEISKISNKYLKAIDAI